MTFHRLAVPSYYGGLPGGYDYINNAVVGTPAPADGAKSGGPNDGTYFVAFGEDATSSNTNRSNSALAENCDYLDDLFHTSQVVIRYKSVTIIVPTNDITLTGQVYVGGSGETPAVVNDQYTRSGLAHLVDTDGNEVVVGGTLTEIALIHDGVGNNQVGVPADGFYTNPTVRLNVTLPAGFYYLYYLERRSLADIIENKPSEFMFQQIRTVEHVPSGLRKNGFDDRYRRSTTFDGVPPTSWPLTLIPTNTAGSGGWIKKDGHPVTAYIQHIGAASGTLDEKDFLFGACFASYSEVTNMGAPSGNTDRYAIGSGYMAFGNARTANVGPVSGVPGFFGLGHWTNRRGTPHTDDATRLEVGTTVSINTDQITLSGSNYLYKNLGAADRSGFVKGIDVLVATDPSGNYHYFTITVFTSATVGTLRYLDGSHPNVAGPATFTIIDWLSPLHFSAEGAVSYYSSLGLSNTNPPEHAGYTFAEPPAIRYGSTPLTPRRYARLFGPDQNTATRVLGWGGYNDLTPTAAGGAKYVESSWCYADGGARFGGPVVLEDTLDVSGTTSLNGDLYAYGTATFYDDTVFNNDVTFNQTVNRIRSYQYGTAVRSVTVTNGQVITWDPLTEGAVLRCYLGSGDRNFTVAFDGSYTYQAGDRLTVIVHWELGTNCPVSVVWPGDFVFSGDDGTIDAESGAMNTAKFEAIFLTTGWYLTRTDYIQ